MTKEISDILNAFKEAQRQGRKTALATVVHVEGSSYRRPGARMLVEDDGKITGAISGGCLEGDALKKALLAIEQQQNKLVTYNTLHEDDVNFGIQLGCNGIVHILFEPIDTSNPLNPITLLEKSLVGRKNAVLVTVFSIKNYHSPQPGTCLVFAEGKMQGELANKEFEHVLEEEASHALQNRTSMLREFPNNDQAAFIELIEPAVSLVIVGAGNDALPLSEFSRILGWQLTVADGRVSHANKKRFPGARQIVVGKPEAVIRELVIDERTVFVLMTHNYNYDLDMLRLLLNEDCKYIGILGPKKKMNRMLEELHQQGFNLTEEKRAKLYGPTGLDIGAETAEEIALSILAEIKTVFSNREGSLLRERLDEIHSRTQITLQDEG